jgi:hypothetical protein
MRHLAVCSLSFVLLLVLSGSAPGQPTTQRIPGSVVAVYGRHLELRIGSGQVIAVELADNVRVSARSAADSAAIAPGAFIGTTAVPRPDGTLAAVEVHVFPESMRGTGEGHRPMDVGAGTTMTNATVASVASAETAPPRNTMTNATVASVAASGQERRITLRYKDGEKIVTVDQTVPVVMIEPGDASMLVPGAHVLVTAAKQADGTLTSDRISVGRNGLVPPI